MVNLYRQDMVNVAMGSQLQDETIMVFILGEEDGKIVWK
jgi:hypothetical protein